MDPFTKLTFITAVMCWIYFLLIRCRSIVQFLAGKKDFRSVIMDNFAGWIFFFVAAVLSNVLLITWLCSIL